MKRLEKIVLLKNVLNGQTTELEQLRAKQGRPYTTEEKATQQEYLTSLLRHEVTQADVTRIFGNYDLSNVVGAEAYMLPNGMIMFF